MRSVTRWEAAVRVLRFPVLLSVCLAFAAPAAAQKQAIIVDQPLQYCGAASRFTLSTFDEAKAAELIEAALGQPPDATTYYIIHATEFVPNRMVVSVEHWYVYYQPWRQKSAFWFFRDSRQFKHFKEQRIFGSSRVGMIYLYVNVPTFASRNATDEVMAFFLGKHVKAEAEADAATRATRTQRLKDQETRFRDDLPPDAEARAVTLAQTKAAAAADASTQDLYLVSALEAERYFRALAAHNNEITSEFALVDNTTGGTLSGLSPTLATTDAYDSLSKLFYVIDVTKKVPAPVQNLKDAIKVAFGGQAGVANRLGVKVEPSSVCAGRAISVDHLPSDMDVTPMIAGDGDKKSEARAKATFDNEGRYWWDISFALPLDFRTDISIDVDAGQVAAKQVEKGDLFAVINLGMPRDTKKIQWQLVPTFVYGMPITGKPLDHHLVGFTIGLNYVQLLGGVRFDRRQVVGTTVENGVPVGVESAPAADKWEHKWVWGINIPVHTVVQLFSKKK